MPQKNTLVRVLIVAAMVGALWSFFGTGLRHEFSLHALQAHRHAFEAYRGTHPGVLEAGFFTLYVISAAASLPIAALLTLMGGAVFGFFEGTLLVSFASTLGATLAFLAAKYLFRDLVQRRFGERWRAIDRGFRREGGLYLFTLRLVPIFPFFVVNLAMGLTSMPARTFYWVSQVAMLPATLLYVNAGTRLANLHGLAGILSPATVISLALLGVFPLLARHALMRWTVRRRQARWPRPKRYERNLVVIGAGSSGLVSAYIAAAVRAKVTLIEGHRMGGDCLNTGCVPSKALIHAARVAAQARAGARVGVHTGDVTIDFRAVMERVQRAIAEVAPHDSVERYQALGVDVRRGRAMIKSPWLVEVDGEPITTRAIIIASGADPIIPDLPGLEGSAYLTSDTLWKLRELPRRLLILGGGPIGCELAQAFARLGSLVVQVQRASQLLVREDPEVAQFVRARLVSDGVDVRTGCKALAIERGADDQALVCEAAGERVRLPFDQLIVAIGRRPRTRGFGLEELGIPASPTVETDGYLATLHPNIFACGDVAGPFQFTHTAAHQAWYASVNALFGQIWRFPVDYSAVPAVTFVDPQVARVGLGEQDARRQGIAYEVTRFDLAELDRAIAEDQAQGFVKVLTIPGKDRILGATIVGSHAGELIAEFTLAMRHGLGFGKIFATIHAYPTWAEANKYAAGAWKKAHAPEGMLRWLQGYHAWRLR